MKFIKKLPTKKKINYLILTMLILLPYIYLIHGHYVGKFDDEIVVVAQGTVVNKNIENVLGGKSRSGYNRYVMVVSEDSGVNKVEIVARDDYYNYPIGSKITLVETVTYVDKHNWFLFYYVICISIFLTASIFGICYLIKKYIDWLNL